jgi:predicted ATPase
VLDGDGHDLAAAIQTIIEIGDRGLLSRLVADAFPGSEVFVEVSRGRFDLQLRGPGLLRPLSTAELSDGTLRYLLLLAALLSPRPPGLLVVNEPETSLHPELLAPLARLMVTASERSQLMVITHAQPLADALRDVPGASTIELAKAFGETEVEGLGRFDGPPWSWGTR